MPNYAASPPGTSTDCFIILARETAAANHGSYARPCTHGCNPAWIRPSPNGMMRETDNNTGARSLREMYKRMQRSRRAGGAALLVATLAGALAASSAPAAAQAPDATDLAEGARLFRQKGNCQACHGWAGDGRKMDSQMPDGANLRESVLDRADLI